jgi:hypothetical protein
VKWYLAKATIRMGQQVLATSLLLDVVNQAPDFFRE